MFVTLSIIGWVLSALTPPVYPAILATLIFVIELAAVMAIMYGLLMLRAHAVAGG